MVSPLTTNTRKLVTITTTVATTTTTSSQSTFKLTNIFTKLKPEQSSSNPYVQGFNATKSFRDVTNTLSAKLTKKVQKHSAMFTTFTPVVNIKQTSTSMPSMVISKITTETSQAANVINDTISKLDQSTSTTRPTTAGKSTTKIPRPTNKFSKSTDNNITVRAPALTNSKFISATTNSPISRNSRSSFHGIVTTATRTRWNQTTPSTMVKKHPHSVFDLRQSFLSTLSSPKSSKLSSNVSPTMLTQLPHSITTTYPIASRIVTNAMFPHFSKADPLNGNHLTTTSTNKNQASTQTYGSKKKTSVTTPRIDISLHGHFKTTNPDTGTSMLPTTGTPFISISVSSITDAVKVTIPNRSNVSRASQTPGRANILDQLHNNINNRKTSVTSTVTPWTPRKFTKTRNELMRSSTESAKQSFASRTSIIAVIQNSTERLNHSKITSSTPTTSSPILTRSKPNSSTLHSTLNNSVINPSVSTKLQIIFTAGGSIQNKSKAASSSTLELLTKIPTATPRTEIITHHKKEAGFSTTPDVTILGTVPHVAGQRSSKKLLTTTFVAVKDVNTSQKSTRLSPNITPRLSITTKNKTQVGGKNQNSTNQNVQMIKTTPHPSHFITRSKTASGQRGNVTKDPYSLSMGDASRYPANSFTSQPTQDLSTTTLHNSIKIRGQQPSRTTVSDYTIHATPSMKFSQKISYSTNELSPTTSLNQIRLSSGQPNPTKHPIKHIIVQPTTSFFNERSSIGDIVTLRNSIPTTQSAFIRHSKQVGRSGNSNLAHFNGKKLSTTPIPGETKQPHSIYTFPTSSFSLTANLSTGITTAAKMYTYKNGQSPNKQNRPAKTPKPADEHTSTVKPFMSVSLSTSLVGQTLDPLLSVGPTTIGKYAPFSVTTGKSVVGHTKRLTEQPLQIQAGHTPTLTSTFSPITLRIQQKTTQRFMQKQFGKSIVPSTLQPHAGITSSATITSWLGSKSTRNAGPSKRTILSGSETTTKVNLVFTNTPFSSPAKDIPTSPAKDIPTSQRNKHPKPVSTIKTSTVANPNHLKTIRGSQTSFNPFPSTTAKAPIQAQNVPTQMNRLWGQISTFQPEITGITQQRAVHDRPHQTQASYKTTTHSYKITQSYKSTTHGQNNNPRYHGLTVSSAPTHYRPSQTVSSTKTSVDGNRSIIPTKAPSPNRESKTSSVLSITQDHSTILGHLSTSDYHTTTKVTKPRLQTPSDQSKPTQRKLPAQTTLFTTKTNYYSTMYRPLNLAIVKPSPKISVPLATKMSYDPVSSKKHLPTNPTTLPTTNSASLVPHLTKPNTKVKILNYSISANSPQHFPKDLAKSQGKIYVAMPPINQDIHHINGADLAVKVSLGILAAVLIVAVVIHFAKRHKLINFKNKNRRNALVGEETRKFSFI